MKRRRLVLAVIAVAGSVGVAAARGDGEGVLTGACTPGQVFDRVDTDGARVMALVIHDGPTAGSIDAANVADRYGATLTYADIGSVARGAPHIVRELLQRGHEVASHTEWHETDGVAEAQETFLALTGERPAFVVPPFGHVDDRLRAVAERAGVCIVRGRSIEDDWAPDADPNAVCEAIVDAADEGVVVSVHGSVVQPDGRSVPHPVGARALACAIPQLIEDGFDLVGLSQLIGS